jgi:hypothetical protein
MYTTATAVSKQTNKQGRIIVTLKKINKREVEGDLLHKAE